MKCELIFPDDHRWVDLLKSAPHDIYHTPEFLVFSGKYEDGSPLAFYGEDQNERFLVPLLARRLPSELGAPTQWRDLITPYGYPSPLLFPGEDSSKLDSFIQAFCTTCDDQNFISAFIRLHPCLPLPVERLKKYAEIVRHGETVALDLTQSEEGMWKQTRENHRRTIKALRRSGFTVKIDDWLYYDDFIKIYQSTMERLAADDFYFFSDGYFDDLRSYLGNLLHLCVVLAPNGEVASGGLFLGGTTILEYHLGGTREKYLKEAPSKLMFDYVRCWAKQAGCSLFHLGGGLGGRSDSLFRFKAGFSKLFREFHTARFIFNPQKYSHLNCARQKLSGAENPARSDFFPLYRNRM